MISTESLNTFDVEQLRHTVLELQSQLLHATALNEKITHEMAVLRRWKFAARSDPAPGMFWMTTVGLPGMYFPR